MRRLVEPPAVGCESERVEDLRARSLLPFDRERSSQERVVPAAAADLRDERDERTLQRVEDLRDACRRHALLVVVEEDVVRLVRRGEAGDVLALQLELALE